MPQQQKLRALVVDDEIPIQRLTAAALAKQGFACDFARDGVQAEEMLATSTYDAVIVDLKMPHRNGHALATDLLRRADRPAVVIHTGVIEPRLAHDLLLRGVDDVLFKPVDFNFLAVKTRVLVSRRATFRHLAADAARDAAPTLAANSAEIVEGRISLPELNDKLRDVQRVLPISPTALEVYQMAVGENWNLAATADAIQRDPALSAEVLRIANSLLYNSSGRPVLEIEEAVVRIGQKRVGELALSTSALVTCTSSMLPWLNLEIAWKRSMAAGIAVEQLIEVGGHQQIESGLLLSAAMHPLGRIVLGMLFPKHYEGMTRRCESTGESLQEQERQSMPTRHTEIMAHLLATWQIAPEIYTPLKFSLDDFSSLARLPEPIRTKTELVKLAIVIGRLAVGEWEQWDLVRLPPPTVFQRLGIKDARAIVRRVREDVTKLSEFQPGAQLQSERAVRPKELCDIAYCNLSGHANDLLYELWPSLGLVAQEYPLDGLPDFGQPFVVNCLGMAPTQFAAKRTHQHAIAVADDDKVDIFRRFGATVHLPCSFATLQSDINSHLRRAS